MDKEKFLEYINKIISLNKYTHLYSIIFKYIFRFFSYNLEESLKNCLKSYQILPPYFWK